jgi:hypothetical protein
MCRRRCIHAMMNGTTAETNSDGRRGCLGVASNVERRNGAGDDQAVSAIEKRTRDAMRVGEELCSAAAVTPTSVQCLLSSKKPRWFVVGTCCCTIYSICRPLLWPCEPRRYRTWSSSENLLARYRVSSSLDDSSDSCNSVKRRRARRCVHTCTYRQPASRKKKDAMDELAQKFIYVHKCKLIRWRRTWYLGRVVMMRYAVQGA